MSVTHPSRGASIIERFPALHDSVHLPQLSPFRSFAVFGFRASQSPDSQAPAIDARRDYNLLASGLSHVLARHPQRLIQREFRAAAAALRLLRRQLRAPFGEPLLAAEMLNDLAHEIALHADADTRAAAARCLGRAVAARRRAALA
ncbi:hypothetical protein HHL11_31770 [Ramlibacter sp. G-1-2-2]|uniref:Uncharacterized protein n=1 Tax=Ramlibacter agri TaxID=2728837 RepID=A0A848HKX0_9BURK|nr:hypothetical protein [Ramlibacter agri]NML48368.1 hypothetical protein [Ramlibacter agri]